MISAPRLTIDPALAKRRRALREKRRQGRRDSDALDFRALVAGKLHPEIVTMGYHAIRDGKAFPMREYWLSAAAACA